MNTVKLTGHIFSSTLVLIALSSSMQGWAQSEKRPPRGPARDKQTNTFRTDIPVRQFDLVLTRPTDKSVAISVLAYKDLEGYVAYGVSKGSYGSETPKRAMKSGEPVEVVIGALKPNTRYFYQFKSRKSAPDEFANSPEYTFVTQRRPSSEFTFTITADSHLDDRSSPDLYSRTLTDALTDAPDFHIDLGDTFMTDKHPDRESAAKQYLAQRYYFGLIGHSSPVFLVLGNHDGETARELDGGADSLGVWSNLMRKRYFPNPIPDGFYTGNGTKHEYAAVLQDYYSWKWGDAQFIVLDPYWFTPKMRGEDDNWKRTLGSEQYQWLKRTLESSNAKFKFVFIHHLVGGSGKDARGGVEAVGLYEWGGTNTDGSDAFKEKRTEWSAPIHKLLVNNHVSVVFHGHDHLFAKQQLDGIIYQEVPQPGFDGRDRPDVGAEYGYKSGEILGGSGYMRVRVSPTNAKVDYVRVSLPSTEQRSSNSGTVVCSYIVSPSVSSK